MKRPLIIIPLLFLCCICLQAREEVSFETLRSWADQAPAVTVEILTNEGIAPEGTLRRSVAIDRDVLVEGWAVSGPDDPNRDFHGQRHYLEVNGWSNGSCLYLESPDGRYGIRFNMYEINLLGGVPQFSRVVINLKGCVLHKELGVYSVTNLYPENIVSVEAHPESDLPKKVRSISELTDDDLFTYVTVKDCEFVFKDGAYINVYEAYTRSGGIKVKGVYPNNAMDGWVSILCNDRAERLYLAMNSRVLWRRDGKGVPQGRGCISGILTKPFFPRYGRMDGYAIRPTRKQDIAFGQPSSLRTIVEWNWNDNIREINSMGGKMDAGPYAGYALKPDEGEGMLFLDVPQCRLSRQKDFNNKVIDAPKTKGSDGDRGAVNYGALQIETEARNWWNWDYDCGNSVILDFSTRKFKGQHLLLAFTMAAGYQSAETSAFYPTWWCVEVSTDGNVFHKVDTPDLVLHSLPWWSSAGNEVSDIYMIPSESAPGLSDRLVVLPSSLLGQERVFVRISPAAKIISSLAYDHQGRGLLTPECKGLCKVRFGTIKIACE